jgi:hypothetical protein
MNTATIKERRRADLEELNRACRRGTTIYAEVVRLGNSLDAYPPVFASAGSVRKKFLKPSAGKVIVGGGMNGSPVICWIAQPHAAEIGSIEGVVGW